MGNWETKSAFSVQDMGDSLVRAFHRMDERLMDPSVLDELKSLSNGVGEPEDRNPMNRSWFSLGCWDMFRWK